MSDILEKILDKKRERLAAAKLRTPLSEIRSRLQPNEEPHRFGARLVEAGTNIIAEVKRRSPSKGIIRENFDPEEIAANYSANGAACLSVLTEEDFFDGSLEYLSAIRVVTGLPLLRKDFIFDDYQVFEAADAGADCILLIAAMLEPSRLNELMLLAYSLGLDVLVEVHDEKELEAVIDLDVRLLGVNNRNLRTFETSLETSVRLARALPREIVLVSESGIRTPQDIAYLKAAGYHAFLIGEEFMRSEDEGRALRELVEGRP